MAIGLNRVELIGNLGKDPELRYAQSGTAVCNVSVATNERTKRDGAWQDHTEWHHVVLFGKAAENMARYCKKGQQVWLEGNLRTREWEKDGVKRWSTEILVSRWFMIGARDAAVATAAAQPQAQAATQPPASQPAAAAQQHQQGGGDRGYVADDEDDLPF